MKYWPGWRILARVFISSPSPDLWSSEISTLACGPSTLELSADRERAQSQTECSEGGDDSSTTHWQALPLLPRLVIGHRSPLLRLIRRLQLPSLHTLLRVLIMAIRIIIMKMIAMQIDVQECSSAQSKCSLRSRSRWNRRYYKQSSNWYS